MTARVDPRLVREAWRRFGPLPKDHKLIVDLFAGGGGASLGIELALGRSPDVAINHDPEAVAMHAANHPDTWHLVSDVWEVSPSAVTAGRTVGLLWASPDCKHFSKAKGGQPVKKRIRALAWIVIKWAREVSPERIILENVEEFATWGPLVQKVDGNGTAVFDLHGSPLMVPCQKRKGQTFQRWRRQLERLGYRVEFRERRAYGSGAGTIRKRLYLIATRKAQPIVWPAATHGDPKKSAGLKPWVTAADCIDWSLPCPSIFDTAEQIMARHGVRAVRPLKPKTMARIAKGMWRYVINCESPFIVPVAHGGGEGRAYSAHDPLNTLTGARRGELALVQPFIAGVGGRMGQTEPRAVTDPAQTLTAKGDAVVVAPFVTKFRNGATGHPIDEPVATITAHQSAVHPAGAAPLGVVAPLLVRTAHGDVDASGHRRGRGDLPVTDPAPTSMASNDAAVVAPYLVRTDMASAFERNGVNSVEEPARTQTTAGSHAVVAPYLVPRYGERPTQEPRALSIEEPMPVIVPTGNGASLVAPHLMTMRDAQKPHEAADRPTHTITAGGAHIHAVAAFLAKHYGDTGQRPGSKADEPVDTITAQDHHAIVEAELQASAGVLNLKGSDRRQTSVEEPAPTLTAQGCRAAEVRAFLMKYHGQGGGSVHAPGDPLPTIDCNDRIGIVTVAGIEYQIIDIGMRMLTPRERFRAQGFPDSYVITLSVPTKASLPRAKKLGVWERVLASSEIEWKAISAEAQGRMVGNSVCPTEARALVAANCADLAIVRGAASA